MIHAFSVELASVYGVNCAIMLEHFGFWTVRNMTNGTNFHDGHWWTYNSQDAYTRIYPYMGRTQVRNTLKKLKTEGLIVEGNYNRLPSDRTKWYALTEKGFALLGIQKAGSESNVASVETSRLNGRFNPPTVETTNDIGQNDQPLPVIYPYIKPDNRPFPVVVEEQRAREGWERFARDYEANIGSLPVTEVEREDLAMFFDEFGPDAIHEFVAMTARKHPDNPHVYFATVCRKHLGKGIRTAEAAKAALMDYDRQKGGRRDAGSGGNADGSPRRIFDGQTIV